MSIITKDLLTKFEIYLRESEKRENTIKKYMHDVGCFVEFAQGREVSKELVLSYKTYLTAQYAPSSVNSMLVALNTFLRFAHWNGCCVHLLKLQKKCFCEAEEELTREEYFALVKAAQRRGNDRMAMLLQTICGSGIRVSELPSITVEAARHGITTISCKGKIRKIILVQSLCKKLLHYAAAHKIKTGSIFVTKTGRPMDRSNIWREMKALCRQAGVSAKKVFPHNLRHLFARIFYSLDKDIAKLADILGHSSIDTTRIYIMSSGTEHMRFLEKMRLII